jgi:predicted secreted Zn-dependent protease
LALHWGSVRGALIIGLALAGCATLRPKAPITLPSTVWPNDTQVFWYDVEGDTEAQLRQAMDAIGPSDQHGERHDAYTAWYVNWNFPFSETEEGCSIGPVSTSVRVVITLPRWRGFTDEADGLVVRWRQYLEALKEHESGHRETAFQAAYAITLRLADVPPKPTCEEAEAAANSIARQLLEQHRAHDANYDEETRHGATQGAVFP